MDPPGGGAPPAGASSTTAGAGDRPGAGGPANDRSSPAARGGDGGANSVRSGASAVPPSLSPSRPRRRRSSSAWSVSQTYDGFAVSSGRPACARAPGTRSRDGSANGAALLGARVPAPEVVHHEARGLLAARLGTVAAAAVRDVRELLGDLGTVLDTARVRGPVPRPALERVPHQEERPLRRRDPGLRVRPRWEVGLVIRFQGRPAPLVVFLANDRRRTERRTERRRLLDAAGVLVVFLLVRTYEFKTA